MAELDKKKRRKELLNEALRDIGMLAIVFAPLDTILSEHPKWWAAVLFLVGGVVTLAAGIELDARSHL